MAIEKTEVRIVSGSLRGRKIACVVHPGMRPTPQAVREALFSILGDAVPDRVFFDVFAGTGVVGLEAVSRGASRAVLIEKDVKQANDIEGYAKRFAVADRAHVLRIDAYRWAERWIPPIGGPVTLFLSPPFGDFQPSRVGPFLKLVGELIAKAPDGSVVVVQAEDGFPIGDLPEPETWDVRKYGRNYLLFRVKGERLEPDPVEEEDTDTGE